MTLLKSGLAGVTFEDADQLENYVLQHRLLGTAWTDAEPWTYARRPHRDDDESDDALQPSQVSPDKADATRRALVARLQPFVTADHWSVLRPVKVIIAELYATLEALQVPKHILEWMAAAQASENFEQRDEHLQVWEELVALLDQMVDLLGEAEMSLDDFAEVLETGLEQFDLAIAPPTVDQVLVGQVNRTRTSPALKSVVIIGLGEGQFPSTGREDSILADDERQTLLARHSMLDIDPGTERRLLDERFLGYLAFTRAGAEVDPDAIGVRRRRSADRGIDVLGAHRADISDTHANGLRPQRRERLEKHRHAKATGHVAHALGTHVSAGDESRSERQ